MTTVVSQGCRPVGTPFVVTKAEDNVVYELAGKPALERLQEVAAAPARTTGGLLSEFVQLGRVIDERKTEFDRGDFLIRNVLGADPEAGDRRGRPGRGRLHGPVPGARRRRRPTRTSRQLMASRAADAALLFTCNGRGRTCSATPDHDASVVVRQPRRRPLAGMFCAGELGPIGGRNFVHGFTASVVLISAG